MGLANGCRRQIENNRADGLPAFRRHDPTLCLWVCLGLLRSVEAGAYQNALGPEHGCGKNAPICKTSSGDEVC